MKRDRVKDAIGKPESQLRTMSPNDPATTTVSEHEPFPNDRYADLTLADGTVLIYDVDATDAWIQSDAAVPHGEVL